MRERMLEGLPEMRQFMLEGRPEVPEFMLEGRPATPGRVLVVDDDPRLNRIFADVLREAGFAVDTVSDGGHALALLERAPFDAIISDLALPGVGGMDLLRTVRERGLEVPVIFVTGTPHLSTAMEAVEFGAFRYLLKPVDAHQLLQVVERAVRMHKLADIKRKAAEYLEAEQDGDHGGLSERFSRALAGLDLAFQPIVRWPQKRLVAYEALLRTSEPSFHRPENTAVVAVGKNQLYVPPGTDFPTVRLSVVPVCAVSSLSATTVGNVMSMRPTVSGHRAVAVSPPTAASRVAHVVLPSGQSGAAGSHAT